MFFVIIGTVNIYFFKVSQYGGFELTWIYHYQVILKNAIILYWYEFKTNDNSQCTFVNEKIYQIEYDFRSHYHVIYCINYRRSLTWVPPFGCTLHQFWSSNIDLYRVQIFIILQFDLCTPWKVPFSRFEGQIFNLYLGARYLQYTFEAIYIYVFDTFFGKIFLY